MKHWWKLLCVLLLAYVLIAGLGVRLSPGILGVDPEVLEAGKSEQLTLQGYNTAFHSDNELDAWLRAEDLRLCADEVSVMGEGHLRVFFSLPKKLPSERADLYLSSEREGVLLYPDAVHFQGREEGDPGGSDCQPQRFEGSEGMNYPFRHILYESIRNLFFHVPMWFGMIGLMAVSFFFSLRYLRSERSGMDLQAKVFVQVGLLFTFLGLATGSLWARHTWMGWWTNDPKLNGAAVTMLIYLAYTVLRSSVRESRTRARVAAVYNIFAFAMLFVFLFILPRVSGESLHPGVGGNPAFSQYDLDDNMRLVFYPAVIGWFLLGFWVARVRVRVERVQEALRRERLQLSE